MTGLSQSQSLQRLLWRFASQHVIANISEFSSALFDDSERSGGGVSSLKGKESVGEEPTNDRALIVWTFVHRTLVPAIARAVPDAAMMVRLLVLHRVRGKLHMAEGQLDQVSTRPASAPNVNELHRGSWW